MSMKRKRILSAALACVMLAALFTTGALAEELGVPAPGAVQTKAELTEGVNVISADAENLIYNVGSGKAIAVKGTAEAPITFTNCTFNISGKTLSINGSGVGYNGETRTKLGVGQYVTFNDCTFLVSNGGTGSGSGNDAAMEFFGPGIVLNRTSVMGTDWQGQFFGLYGSAEVTVKDSALATTGNTGGWSYAMYGTSVLRLENSSMAATGMRRAEGGGNVNAFYSGDLRTNYDAIFIENSTVDFSDNHGGGFAINNVNIHVNNSDIIVCDNAGNGSNSGVWYVKDSTLRMCGNSAHGWSHVGDQVENSTIEILHNGYAGYYITSDSAFINCTVDVRCNGERLLSYSAGDMWLNTHTLALRDCPHVWLGAVGRKGTVSAENCAYVVAYDLYENKTKSNTEPVLIGLDLSEQDLHTLFLNGGKEFDYARGDTEGKNGNSNDDDLFEDVEKETAIGAKTAKIGALTTAQLSHHKYDWENGTVTEQATETCYGVVRYTCTDVCSPHMDWTVEHAESFDCAGVYVYAPLVGLHFDANAQGDPVTMPADQTEIPYGQSGTAPEQPPVRYDGEDDWNWVFTGWFADPACEQPFDFSAALTKNWTVVYAGWEKVKSGEGALSISKTVINGDLNQDFTFTVTWKDTAGKELTDTFTYTGSKTGTISSGGTLTLRSGQTVTINHLPVDASYVVTETLVANYTATISGHDATEPYYGSTAEGMILSGTGANVHYTNTYQSTPVTPPSSNSSGTSVPAVKPSKPPVLNTEDHEAYIIGYVDGTVRPLDNIKRSEVATIFFRLLTDESRAHYWSQQNPYSDVAGSSWYNNAVSTLTNAGIITGYPDDTFRPDAPISRSEFAAIAARFSEVSYNGGNSFTDVPSDHWAARYIALAEHLGWIKGYPDGSFKPEQAITRAEAMTLINRVLERDVEEEHMLSDMVTWPDNQPGAWYYEAVQEATNSHTYTRRSETVPEQDFCYEQWQTILEVPDWAGLERTWSTANSK